jgi:hypothetical protein
VADAALTALIGALGGTAISGGLALWGNEATGNREDRRALAADRKKAYVDFLVEWRRCRDALWDSEAERPVYEEPPDSWWNDVSDLVDPIRLLGGDRVAEKARDSINSLRLWAGTPDQLLPERTRAMNGAFADFLREARKTLGAGEPGRFRFVRRR